ncbi:MAG: hydroxymethylglutaryl-CoA reductase, degradative [Candidatus Diapherotrites archaeon]|nr:hydroxymethylglutaryl-CoA reductase, degradative [Candidatus Diapherotrites archaeon]
MDPFSKFYEKTYEERIKLLKDYAKLSDDEIALLAKETNLSIKTAECLSENIIGTFSMPLGIATHFVINGKNYILPMVIEEPSVVAAASNAAKLSEGFLASADDSIMFGQIQIVGVKDIKKTISEIKKNQKNLINKANSKDSVLVSLGGGVKDVKIRKISTDRGEHIIVNLIVDVKDAMGANAVNSFCESLKEDLEKISGGKVRARIISNLCVARLAKAKAVWLKEKIGEETIEAILDAYHFAKKDQFRCTTHNKGIMNGIDALAIATGQDFRAIEASAHSYAAFKRKYSPLTKYYKDNAGNLIGEIEIPLAVGVVGGAVRTNPLAKLCLKIANISSAKELAMSMACVGLANNFAALKALSTEGIQKGHMRLHAKNIAITAGASEDLVDKVAEIMVKENNICVARAKEIISELK